MTQPRSPQPPAPYPEEVPRTPLRTRFDLDGGRALELGRFYQVGTGTMMGDKAGVPSSAACTQGAPSPGPMQGQRAGMAPQHPNREGRQPEHPGVLTEPKQAPGVSARALLLYLHGSVCCAWLLQAGSRSLHCSHLCFFLGGVLNATGTV